MSGLEGVLHSPEEDTTARSVIGRVKRAPTVTPARPCRTGRSTFTPSRGSRRTAAAALPRRSWSRSRASPHGKLPGPRSDAYVLARAACRGNTGIQRCELTHRPCSTWACRKRWLRRRAARIRCHSACRLFSVFRATMVALSVQPVAKADDSGSTRSVEFRTLDSHGDGQKTGGSTGVADVGGHGGPSDE